MRGGRIVAAEAETSNNDRRGRPGLSEPAALTGTRLPCAAGRRLGA